jgi:oligoribonuclease NrnB/cAMP/cGMP phosphodiesterase (DHH superfamily)
MGCVICAYNTVADKSQFRYEVTGYNAMEKKIEKFAKSEKWDAVIISDLNMNEEQIASLKAFGNVPMLYCDHHKYHFDLKAALHAVNPNIILIHDEDHSATANLFMYFARNHKWNNIFPGMRNMVTVINTYDMWMKDKELFKEEAVPFNDLFFEYGPMKFMSKFKDKFVYDKEDGDIIDRMHEEREKYLTDAFDNFRVENPAGKVLMIFQPNSKYINDFTIYYPDYVFYLMLKEYDEDTRTYSVRINSENDKLTIQNLYSKIYEKTGYDFKRGGHEKAGGVVIPAEFDKIFLETFMEVCEEFINA